MADSLIIKDVSVISMTGSEVSRNDVVIHNNRIVHIGSNTYEKGCEIIDGSGKYLLPGLFDMHAHLDKESHFSLFLMNGVTGIREMGNTRDDIFELKKMVNSGETFGPRMYICGPILEGYPPFWEGFKVITTKHQAIEAVKQLEEKGADFIKVYHSLEKPVYETVVKEALSRNLRVTGHIPQDISIIEAIETGQTGIEHMNDINDYVIDIEMRDARNNEEPGYMVFTNCTVQEEPMEELLEKLTYHDTYICPTLILDEQMSRLADYEQLKQIPEAQYLDSYYKDIDWNPRHPESSSNINGLAPLFFQNLNTIHKASKPLVKKLATNSTLLAGSDTPNPFVVPGFSLIQELELLVDSGVSNYEVLEAATCNGTDFLGVSDDVGTIEVGKIANLVLLNDNPLEDITALKNNSGTILNGVFYPKEYLEKLASNM